MDTDPMARSSKSRKRPMSRGSTTSVHSATTQPNLDQTFGDASDFQDSQWLSQEHSQPRELAPASHQLSPEDLILQAASQLQGSREFSMDPTINGSANHGGAFQSQNNLSRHSLSADSFAGNGSFADDSQMMDGTEDGDSFAGMPGAQKSGSRSSANNELEMRQLFVQNKTRTLQDVAQELHGNERGPNSERTRQVFAMLWINQVCSKGKGSVPRGRVYANYASRCATERITVLNPASFGKLVRVLFPGLKTRRLGVRGESKYHYVNFQLAEDQPDIRELPSQPSIPLPEATSFTANFNLSAPPRVIRPERSSFPTTTDVIAKQPEQQAAHSRDFTHGLFNHPNATSVDQLQSNMTKTPQLLSFSSDSIDGAQPGDSIVLPKIEPFLPGGTDPDAAKSLTALYRSHCTSLVECVRYCKEKTFFHLFTSFQGTLTMPVQKLFGNPAVAPWIEECDFILYQRMMRILSGLTLQVVPKQVLDMLRNIHQRLVSHIRESFQGQPLHVIRAKEAPATIFAGLLDRALRVNLTAHAAANMLSNHANRDLMYIEWISMINLRKVAENVPIRAMDDVVNLLLTQMRELLDPVDIPWDLERTTIYGDFALRNGRQPHGSTEPGATDISYVLDRWVKFFELLPSRFSYASHTDIVLFVQRIGTSVMRDLTIHQGKSFGSWWVTKCWIDEMIQFMVEQGGFMKLKTTRGSQALGQHQETNREVARAGSRFSNGSDDFNISHMTQSQPDRAPFPSAPAVTNHETPSKAGNASHDDSGIGIRTPDEELPMEKFSFTPANAQHLFTDAELQKHIANL